MLNDFENRYTPKSVDDIVFEDDHSHQLIEDLITGARPFPIREGKCGILLYGVPGTGKSALAKIFPDAMEKSRSGQDSNMKYFRVQRGSNGAALMQKLQNQSNHVPLSTYHYFVLDEVDELKNDAMSSLKSLMNMPDCVFVLTTNNYQDIEVGVRNRCHCISFNAAPPDKWLNLCRRILDDEGILNVSDQTLLKVIATGKGSARDILDAVMSIVIDWNRVRRKQSQNLQIQVKQNKPEVLS